MSNLTIVSAETLERRLDACAACSNFVMPPDSGDHRRPSDRSMHGLCALTGGSVTHQARLADENCPAASEDNPTLSRWGEVMGVG